MRLGRATFAGVALLALAGAAMLVVQLRTGPRRPEPPVPAARDRSGASPPNPLTEPSPPDPSTPVSPAKPDGRLPSGDGAAPDPTGERSDERLELLRQARALNVLQAGENPNGPELVRRAVDFLETTVPAESREIHLRMNHSDSPRGMLLMAAHLESLGRADHDDVVRIADALITRDPDPVVRGVALQIIGHDALSHPDDAAIMHEVSDRVVTAFGRQEVADVQAAIQVSRGIAAGRYGVALDAEYRPGRVGDGLGQVLLTHVCGADRSLASFGRQHAANILVQAGPEHVRRDLLRRVRTEASSEAQLAVVVAVITRYAVSAPADAAAWLAAFAADRSRTPEARREALRALAPGGRAKLPPQVDSQHWHVGVRALAPQRGLLTHEILAALATDPDPEVAALARAAQGSPR